MTLMTAMRNYQAAHKKFNDLKKDHDACVQSQRELLSAIGHAEAEANQAREAMLRLIESRPSEVK